MSTNNKIGSVISSSPSKISIQVLGLEIFEENKLNFQIGRYLKIADGNHNFAIVSISNITSSNSIVDDSLQWSFQVDCTPIGALVKKGETHEYTKGSHILPVPTEPVYVMDDEAFGLIFSTQGSHNFCVGELANNKAVKINLDGNKLFSKHIGVVGSTGSGKSCAVTNILQGAVGISEGKYILERVNNSHIVIFDLHAEYAAAFKIDGSHDFTLSELTVDKLQLPYWLMNSEELESMFIESNESNSYNQVSIFKRAVILNKKKHNPTLSDVNYDTPCYFSLFEVLNYIDNTNREVIGRLAGEGKPKLSDDSLVTNTATEYFLSKLEFATPSTAAATKASVGPFHGEFNRFISRMETRLSDERLKFIVSPRKANGSEYLSDDFELILKQFIGYINRSNVSIVDLSGIPFEVLSITVSLISRLIFDFCFHYSKIRHQSDELNDVPVLLVCEEAHNYVPSSDSAMYKASRRSIERIAKEGRKYGISLMVVSQRPSEVSSTIFAQCNNFFALRLTNSADQNYIKNLLPDNTSSIADVLPNLAQGEALIVGDATIMASLVQMPKPIPEPKSASIDVFDEWGCDWKNPAFADVIKRWRKEAENSPGL